MGKYIISVGHVASGNLGSGASDLLDESNCTREIAPLVCNYLEKEGNQTYLLRVDKNNSYNFEDCYIRSNQANDIAKHSNIDLFVEIHLNSGKNRTGDGTEVCVSGQSSIANQYATRISESISKALNIDNRGLKQENLIVLKRANIPSILVECMFVDCNDPSKYNADIIAKAIAEGILGKKIITKPTLGWNKSQDGTKWWYCTDVNNEYYYKSEWKLIDNKWFLFNDLGFCVTNWVQQDNQWYYLEPISCSMAIGWKEILNRWYYFNQSGVMQTGWIKDNDKDYCLYSSGEMICNCDYMGYHFDSNGVATKL